LSTSHKCKIRKIYGSGYHAFWSAPSPRIEARALFALVGRNDTTVDEIRKLIAIPAETEQLFRSYSAAHPEDESSIARVVELRRQVAQELEQLVGHYAGMSR
jgi:hypothetical protein